MNKNERDLHDFSNSDESYCNCGSPSKTNEVTESDSDSYCVCSEFKPENERLRLSSPNRGKEEYKVLEEHFINSLNLNDDGIIFSEDRTIDNERDYSYGADSDGETSLSQPPSTYDQITTVQRHPIKSNRKLPPKPFKMEAPSAIRRRRMQMEIDRQNFILLRKLQSIKPIVSNRK